MAGAEKQRSLQVNTKQPGMPSLQGFINQAEPRAIKGGVQVPNSGARFGPSPQGTKSVPSTGAVMPKKRKGSKPGEVMALANIRTLSKNRTVRTKKKRRT